MKLVYKISLYVALGVALFSENGCKKLIDVKAPVTSVNEANVYNNDASAISVLTGIYANMSTGVGAGFCGNQGISLLGGLSSDEFTLYAGSSNNMYISYYGNKLVANPSENLGSELWAPFYNLIFSCNAAIEGLTKSTSLTPRVKQQLLGEAKFLRGYFYFYLVNFFGDVPLALGTDHSVNLALARSKKEDIYQQIMIDLKDATDLLSTEYLDGKLQSYPPSSSERLRPTKWAAAALLARVYLYIGDWNNAEIQATYVITNSTLFGLETLNGAFLKNNKEAIWQLQPVKAGYNTPDGFTFILPATGPNDDHPVYLSPQLLKSFEAGDKRRPSWVDSVVVSGIIYYYPHKYKVNLLNSNVTEYQTMLRLSEQYLIRAEASVQLNKIGDAQNDLNFVRNRAGLTNTALTDKSLLLVAILRERQVELFTELAQRWLDLKRTGTVDSVMGVVTPSKGGQWQSYQQLYPVLYLDIQRDHNLNQNTGY